MGLSNLIPPGAAKASQNRRDFLEDAFIAKYAIMAKLPESEIECLIKDKNALLEREDITALLVNFAGILRDNLGNRSAFSDIPDFEKRYPDCYGTIYLLLLLACYQPAIDFLSEKGYSLPIVMDSLTDLGLWIAQYRRERDICGVTKRIFGWTSGFLCGDRFQIGRLQFNADCKFPNIVHVFRNKQTRELKALMADDIVLNSTGLYNGIGNFDDPEAWSTSYCEEAEQAVGYPVSVNGFASKAVERLNLQEWEKVLSPDDSILNVHIPASGPMLIEDCIESYKRARKFFSEHFPDTKYKAFICESWFLDPQFEKLLKPTSNIMKFQKSGHLFPFFHESECIFRVFGEKAVDEGIDSVQHKSGMQKAFAEFARGGGIFHNGGWFLMLDDIDDSFTPYH